MMKEPSNGKILKRFLIIGSILLLIGIAVYFYLATLTYEDTANVKPDYSVEAIAFIKEFEKDSKSANTKYAERIISVSGIVTATETADTTINIKMTDTSTNSYLIFAFQKQYFADARTIKTGDKVKIKGSCSDAIYSDIIDGYSISFKRSTIDK